MPNVSFLWQWEEIPADNKWRLIRQHRAELLAACDWTQLPDAVLTFDERTAWQDYRQALRDIPQTFTDPDLVVLPERP